ncbi:MAG: methyltransferase domain-containing protein [Alphaproteobacteria bacterium]|nr:methyltransferase domain-containing protein [Alphaproteobacteria bacterium]
MTNTKKEIFRETVTFIKQWARNPFQMGSIIPSSRALANLISRCALDGLSDDCIVLELGSGTGRFTKSLLDAGLSPERLIVMEVDPTLISFLKHRFPNLTIIQGNAAFLTDLLPKESIGRVGVIVSGLPMLSLSSVVQEKVLQSCLDVLYPGGSLLQMTYSPFSSISAERYGMCKTYIGCAWSNIPPANLWRYTRKVEE